jgi:hypothetical protein
VMSVMVNLISVRSEMVLESMYDMCMVCVERTVGSVTILVETNGTPRLRGSSESSFQSLWR